MSNLNIANGACRIMARYEEPKMKTEAVVDFNSFSNPAQKSGEKYDVKETSAPERATRQKPDNEEVKGALITLNTAISRAKGAQKNLERFRTEWNITDRAAVYPKSLILHFAILAGLILFEGMANAYFFSAGSDLGLLGGWLQAITISFVNVISAFFVMGFLGLQSMSYLTQYNKPGKMAIGIFAALGVIGTALALLGLNVTAAHYRDMLELNAASLALGSSGATGDVLKPVEAALANPFGIVTLEALLLLILGVTFAIIAAYKGRTFDDVIPGYGRVTRKLESASVDLEKALKAIKKNTMSEDELQSALDLHSEIGEVLAGPPAEVATIPTAEAGNR